jgi:lipoic acid synthetase
MRDETFDRNASAAQKRANTGKLSMAVVIDFINSDPRSSEPRMDGEARARHPEKAHRPDQPVARKPDWIRVKA